VTIGQITDKSN